MSSAMKDVRNAVDEMIGSVCPSTVAKGHLLAAAIDNLCDLEFAYREGFSDAKGDESTDVDRMWKASTTKQRLEQ
jgi:hypothetical protein